MANEKPDSTDDAHTPSGEDVSDTSGGPRDDEAALEPDPAAPAVEDAETVAEDRSAEAEDVAESDADASAVEPLHEPGDPEPDAWRTDSDPQDDPATDHIEHADEVHEEEHGRSFAARALTALLLLLAGAAIGIWGAPKLAPMLPSGMSGVAEWLTPGASESGDRIAALESRFETDLGQVSAQIADLEPTDDVQTTVTSAVDAAQTTLQAEIASIRDQIAQTDPTETTQRLAQLETAIDGQKAELASIKEQLTGGAQATSALSEETVAKIDLYRAELDGLRAELATQSDKVSALDGRIAEVDAKAGREIETAQARVAEIEQQATTQVTVAATQTDLAQVRAALAAGQPFADALQPLIEAPDVTVPESLVAIADTGAPTINRLRDQFAPAAHDAMQASILTSSGDGLLSRTSAFFKSQVASRSLTPQEGMDPDAVLSRMEQSLREDDLAGALAESEALPTEASDAMSGWLAAARNRLDAEAALAQLTAELSATN